MRPASLRSASAGCGEGASGSLQKPKRPEPCGPGRWIVGSVVVESLDLHDVRGAGPLRAVHDLETHAIALVEGAEPFSADLRVMNEDVGAALTGQETKPLRLVEPLHRTFDHE